MTYIVSSGALNSTHSLTRLREDCRCFQTVRLGDRCLLVILVVVRSILVSSYFGIRRNKRNIYAPEITRAAVDQSYKYLYAFLDDFSGGIPKTFNTTLCLKMPSVKKISTAFFSKHPFQKQQANI